MTFPNFKDKHLEEALFNPDDFIKYKKIKKKFPKKFIIIYDRRLFNRMKRKYSLKKFKSYFGGIYIYKNIGILVLKGIGSPHAVTFLEELISLEAKEFVNIGLAGGLQKQGFFLCEKALRDEGTSYHYIPHGDFSYPDEKLTEKLGRSLKKLDIKYEKAPTWTIDAPYRETKAEISEYKNKGIATVEMEASALFAVAKFRKVKIASAFVVSDVLGEKWEPKFHKIDVQKGLTKLFEAALECLK
jgi:uridine phosphorylase